MCADSPLVKAGLDIINSDLQKQIRRGLEEIKSEIKTTLDGIRTEFSNEIKNLRDNVENVNNFVKTMDDQWHTEISYLEVEINKLHKRLNRNDIIISGLPEGLTDLIAPAISIAKHFGINITATEIQQISYIFGKKAILTKFVSANTRDRILTEYFKARNMVLKNVIGGDITSRVYLNEHLSPLANKLNYTCRKLLKHSNKKDRKR